MPGFWDPAHRVERVFVRVEEDLPDLKRAKDLVKNISQFFKGSSKYLMILRQVDPTINTPKSPKTLKFVS